MIARRLDLHIAWQFTIMLVLILGGAGIIIFLVEYIEVLRRLSDEAGLTAALAIRLAAMRVPILLDIVLPFAFLFAALLSLLSLSRKLELVVVRASGVSVWGFLRAPFAVALVLGALATMVLNPVAVGLKSAAENVEAEMSDSARRGGQGHWFRQEGGDGGSIVHGASVTAGGLALLGVTAFVFDADGEFREKVAASRADLTEGRWILPDAEIVSASSAPRRVDRYELPTTLDAGEIGRNIVPPEAVALWSLPAVIATAERTGLSPDRFRLAFHRLLNRPLFLLAMVMIAATVSLRLTRYGGTWKLILTGAATGFLLYVLTEIVSDFGGNGIINPVLAAWLPPIVALTFGATALLHQEDG